MEESTIEQQPKSWTEKVKGRLKAFIYSTTHEAEKISIDQITSPTIADLVTKNDWQEPFSIVDILQAFGYTAPWNKTDYRDKFPDEYNQTRAALNSLSARGGLQTINLEKPDINKETIHYQVVDEEKLGKIAAEKERKTP